MGSISAQRLALISLLCVAACASGGPLPQEPPVAIATCSVPMSSNQVFASQPENTTCEKLLGEIQKPGDFVANGQIRLDAYEHKVRKWMKNLCYREPGSGNGGYAWVRDHEARDTGPYVAEVRKGKLEATAYTTHVVARVWYSPGMIGWMETNRPPDEKKAMMPADPVPEGAIVVKEMWPSPASRYRGCDWDNLAPGSSGAVIFIRDSKSFSSGWFSGWYGEGSKPDWPPLASNPLTTMGQGGAQFCINCHASTVSGNTYVTLENVHGKPPTFSTQEVPDEETPPSHHLFVNLPVDRLERLGEPLYHYDEEFLSTYPPFGRQPDWQSLDLMMPSQTFDNVLVPGGGPKDNFLTSSQCVGCHQANATGLSKDMLINNPHPHKEFGDLPISVSPYSLWSSSPMGLAGRDPIFFAQLESEQILHDKPGFPALIQDTCLQCHGNMAQRQHAIDSYRTQDRDCGMFSRDQANAVPYPNKHGDWNTISAAARYGALARDGISCTTCHHIAIGKDGDAVEDEEWNACIKKKQASLNRNLTGFASTFTGSHLVGSSDTIIGPYEDPLVLPMENSLGVEPVYSENTKASEICGTCHTIHLPVLDRKKPNCVPGDHPDDPLFCYPKRYEQTTYPEWAFSAYRTGWFNGEKLPSGPGSSPKSCQDCHMPSADENGKPYRSKIASIEEYSNYPEADYRLPAKEIDLPVRDGFARHTLVGLNVFLIKIAQQFPDFLGIRVRDAGVKDVPPLVTTEQAMLDQAANSTATITAKPVWEENTLTTDVTIDNLVGHRFPSGVSFRRAFVEFSVLDEGGKVIWASGMTNKNGVIVDEEHNPIAGELWWKRDCSGKRVAAPIKPSDAGKAYQPHFCAPSPEGDADCEAVTKQDQAQVYQEVVTNAKGELTTSFLSINNHLKDNRLQPHGFLPEAQRVAIARALGDNTPLEQGDGFAMDENVGSDDAIGPYGLAQHDPDYESGSGQDTLRYVVSGLSTRPAKVRARLYYQATPPFYLQDRFCVAKTRKNKTDSVTDTERLYFLTGHLNVDGTEIDSWKLKVGDTGSVVVPRQMARSEAHGS